MFSTRLVLLAGAFGLAVLLLPLAHSQQPLVKAKAATPRLEPVADTHLLMEGLAAPNLRGLGKILNDKPREAEAWTFGRGQALLLAETGNLLLMRPPRTPNTIDSWMANAAELRDSASALARNMAAKDYAKSRAGLAAVANVCNHCHQTFKVPNRVDPFADN